MMRLVRSWRKSHSNWLKWRRDGIRIEHNPQIFVYPPCQDHNETVGRTFETFRCLKLQWSRTFEAARGQQWCEGTGVALVPEETRLSRGLLGERLLFLWSLRLERRPDHWMVRTSGLRGPCLEEAQRGTSEEPSRTITSYLCLFSTHRK